MLRPDEIDKLCTQINVVMYQYYRKSISLEAMESVVHAINLAGYKLVKSDE